jgi:uncharacterized membrane protein YoaK (UPF0700 family)
VSGNSVSPAVHTGEGNITEAFHRGFPISCFVFGVALGAVLSEALARYGRRRIFAAAAGLVTALLLLFLLWREALLSDGKIPSEPAWRFCALVALLMAIGVQILHGKGRSGIVRSGLWLSSQKGEKDEIVTLAVVQSCVERVSAIPG